MTEFVFGAYRIRVDVEATRAYYAAHPLPWITCDCDLLPDDFPRPCFQMETDHRLPWVLHEPNPY